MRVAAVPVPQQVSWSGTLTIVDGGCTPTLADFPPPALAARAAGKRGNGPKACRLRKRQTPPTLPQKPASNPLTQKEWQYLGGKLLPRIREQEAEVLFQAGEAELAEKLLIAATPLAPYELYTMATSLGMHATELIKLDAEYDDWFKLFAKDPPDAATTTVALPSATIAPAAACRPVTGRYASRALAACDAAKPLFDAVAADTAQSTALLDAALTTANRYATALRDGQTAAAALQQTAEAILATELAAAAATERADRLALAEWERAQGLSPSFTRGQLLSLARELRALRGLPSGLIRSLGPSLAPARLATAISRIASQVGPGRVDVISALRDAGAPAPLAAADPDVTPATVASVVAALTAQGSVSEPAQRAALAALDALSAAASPAGVQAALARLTAAAQTVGGPAGAFLSAAERLLAASH